MGLRCDEVPALLLPHEAGGVALETSACNQQELFEPVLRPVECAPMRCNHPGTVNSGSHAKRGQELLGTHPGSQTEPTLARGC